uniref:Birch protein n=1 Tax=Betula platyphylla TaxID=78630 RepID=A0A9E9L8J3_BETPL|nr:birch protein [Betula platyphylla]
MKIQCDVCNKEPANVFCPADEAALCDGCDKSIHHANKLSSKHTRFSLIHPSFKEAPLCDICQERRAFVFCKEDRAIFCRECDVPIHKANEHTQKHNRFLLTGVKLHASPSLYPASSSSNGCDANIDSTEIRSSRSSIKRAKTIPNELITSTYKVEENQISDTVSISTSSISEYLMETLPGWRVEDFLEPSIATNGFCKTYGHSLPVVDDQDLERNMSPFSAEDLAIWVPQASPHQSPAFPLYLPQTDFLNGFKESSAEATNVKMSSSRKWIDDGFTVPQISPPSLKKSRHFG